MTGVGLPANCPLIVYKAFTLFQETAQVTLFPHIANYSATWAPSVSEVNVELSGGLRGTWSAPFGTGEH